MENTESVKTNLDLVFCIDATGSMAGIIDSVKDKASTMFEDVRDALERNGRHVENLRIKVIGFRDYFDGDAEPMIESGFFCLPQQKDEYVNFVKGLEAKEGGDIPENSLEALTLAIKSDWVKEGKKKRHVIVLFTDAPAHNLEETAKRVGSSKWDYPSGMPQSIQELGEIWGTSQSGKSMDPSAKRLIIFAPDVYPWKDLGEGWDNAYFLASPAGKDINEKDFNEILDVIARSV